MTRRHNNVRDLLAGLMREAGCKPVETEPHLQPIPPGLQRRVGRGPRTGAVISTDADDARLDVLATGVWGDQRRAFFDIRVTDPLAPSYISTSLDQHKKSQEKLKKNSYNDRVLQVERASFTPLVFTVAGGAGREASRLMSILGERIASKTSQPKSAVMGVMRTRLSYTLIRANTVCLRGHKGPPRRAFEHEASYEMVQAEAHLNERE